MPFWKMSWIRTGANGCISSFHIRSSSLYDPSFTNICYEHLAYHLFLYKFLHTYGHLAYDILSYTIFFLRSFAYEIWHTIFFFRTFAYYPLASDVLSHIRSFSYEHLSCDLFLHKLLLTIFCRTIFCPVRSLTYKLLAYEHSAYELLSCNPSQHCYWPPQSSHTPKPPVYGVQVMICDQYALAWYFLWTNYSLLVFGH